MYKYFNEKPERIHFLFGIVYLVVGALIGIYFKCINDDSQCAIQWSTIFIAVGIAFIAYGSSRKSDELTLKIARSALNETINIIEDARLLIREKSEKIKMKKKIFKEKYTKEQLEFDRDVDYKINYSFKIWKLVRYMDRLKIFEKLLTPREKNIIINQINHYLKELVEGKALYQIHLDKDYYKNLQGIVDDIFKFKEFHDESSIRLINRKESILTNLKLLNPSIKLEKK